ncbi:MAG TPA: cysteine synthase family protein [Bacteroidota bacterium]|nr:cysteine synthase family protein [Bacteroidota bacterium]
MFESQTYRAVGAPTLVERVGNTPLLRLPAFPGVSPRVEILAKAEWHNPGGSVKDRSALSMIRDGERSGALTHGKTLIDATSGNTGIAYAMLGAALGYRVRLAVPANAGSERKRILFAYGASVTYTDPLEGTDGAQLLVKKIVAENPDEYFYPDQYNNPANWQAHYRTTAPEIYAQTGRSVTHFVAGIGTSGTFVGTSRRLKEFNPSIRCISFQPDTPLHGLEGLKHLETAIVPGIYDAKLADEHLEVSTDAAHEMARRLAKTEGILVGVSSAASMVAALRIAQRLEEGVIVTVFPDHGSRYLSERFWEE